MSKNISNLIFNEVSKTNRNRYNITKEVLKEETSYLMPRFDSAQSFYNKATIDENGDDITLISYQTPIVRVKDGKLEFLCGEDALSQTTMRHIRDFIRQMDYDGKLGSENIKYPITRRWVIERLNNTINEEVTVDNPSEKNNKEEKLKKVLFDLADEYEDADQMRDALKSMESNGEISSDEYDELNSNWDKWLLNRIDESAKILKEAPEDEEEFELVEDPGEMPPEDTPMEEPTEEEMTDEEVQDEAKEDEKDTIEDDIEQPFYATTPEFDELREILVDLDYRLFLINDNMVCIGRLNGPDIEFLTSNRPENTETETSEQNDKAEEIETKAEEDGEQAFEYKWIKAPDTFDKFVNQVNVVYLSPEMSEEDKEQYAGIEASHESVMNFLMNELPEEKKEEKEEEEELEELPEELPEEPIEELSEEPTEEVPEEEEEKPKKKEDKEEEEK